MFCEIACWDVWFDTDLKHKFHKTFFVTHSLTPHSTVLEKLTGLQPVKKFPTFYETRRFITAFTSLYPEPVRSSPYPPPPHPTSWRSILILSSWILNSFSICKSYFVFLLVCVRTHVFIVFHCVFSHSVTKLLWFLHPCSMWHEQICDFILSQMKWHTHKRRRNAALYIL
jgi:hypothetical protein